DPRAAAGVRGAGPAPLPRGARRGRLPLRGPAGRLPDRGRRLATRPDPGRGRRGAARPLVAEDDLPAGRGPRPPAGGPLRLAAFASTRLDVWWRGDALVPARGRARRALAAARRAGRERSAGARADRPYRPATESRLVPPGAAAQRRPRHGPTQ